MNTPLSEDFVPYRQFILPTGVVAIIASILIPLPIYVIDFLFVSSLLLSVFLLLRVLTAETTLELISFPTWILLATLFRLSINISSTRLMLSELRVGTLIESISSLLTAGNLVVGVVIFVILTVVQLLVVAKGAERVAEVSARFALDSMPGKQMSIEADMRSGLLDADEARRARSALEEESKFFGALDGAMKFVKGDAIIGLFVLVVNFIGLALVAYFDFGYDASKACTRAIELAVGDGLLALLPALFASVAAGVLVTRVVQRKSLASDMLTQLLEANQIQRFLGFLCLLCLLFPGSPRMVLLVVASLLFGMSSWKPADELVEKKDDNVVPAVLELQIPGFVREDEMLREFMQMFEVMREQLFRSFGLLIPKPALRFYEGAAILISLRGDFYRRIEISPESNPESLVRRVFEALGEIPEEFVDTVFTRSLLERYRLEQPELIESLPERCSIATLTVILKRLVSAGIPIRNFHAILQVLAENVFESNEDKAVVFEEVRASLSRSICTVLSPSGQPLRVLKTAPQFEYQAYCALKEKCPLPNSLIEEFVNFIRDYETEVQILEVSASSRPLIDSYVEATGSSLKVFSSEELRHLERIEVACFGEKIGSITEIAA